MASFKESMRSHVAGSMQDRPGPAVDAAPQAGPAGRSSIERQTEGRRRLDSACVIRLDRIVADPNQPRGEFDPEALARLADSLRERGQLQPIRLRWDDAADRYVVVVGERRWRAAALAGMETIAAVVVAGPASPEDLLEDQLVENALREDLKPIEQARAYRALMDARGLSQRQLAERLRIGSGSVARAVALLALPGEIRERVDAGEIGPNVAYELTKVDDPAEQAALAREAAGGLLRHDDLAGRPKPRATGQARARGAAPRKMTARTFKASGGMRVTVENRRGVDLPSAAEALREILAQIEATAGAPPAAEAGAAA